jgi:hypothetical protein
VTGAQAAYFLLLTWQARGMEIRRGGGGDASSLYIEEAQPISRRRTLYSVPNTHIRRCLPRPVSCHTPGSGAVSAMRDRHDLAQGLPAPRMWCTCTPGFGYPGCRAAAVGNLRRRLPSACSVSKLRRLLPSASSVGELRRRALPASPRVLGMMQPRPLICRLSATLWRRLPGRPCSTICGGPAMRYTCGT